MMKLLSLLIIMIIIKEQCCQEDLPAINVMVVHQVSAKEGDIANLFCNYTLVNSVGDVDIKWYTRVLSSYYVIASASGNSPVVLEGSSLIDRDRYVITDMATLEIDNASRYDTGQYKCEVLDSSNSSIGDYGTVNFTVTYFDLPVFFEISPSEVEIGLSTKLSCEVKASYPRADVTFWRESEQLQVDGEKYYDAINGMWITNVYIDDDGEYTCLADNGIEQHYAGPITLTVQFAPIIYPLKPIEVYANEEHKLRFTFDAEPQGSYIWLDDQGDVIEGETGPYLEVKFYKSDIGLRTNFTFVVTNYLGSDQQTVTVIVILQTSSLTSGEVAVIVVCSCFATAALVFLVMYLKRKYARRKASKNLKRPSRQETLGTSLLSRASKPTDSWEIVRNKLVLKEVIGEGFFGKVIRAEFYLKGKKGKTTVAIKTLKDDCKTTEKFRLQDELALMKTFDKHPNIIDLIGCCTIDDPFYIVLEFAPFGNLRDYLFKSRKSNATTPPVQESEDAAYETVNFDAALSPPSADDLTSFAWQITRAMSYLASIKCVHRDLAARNVLLTYDKRCKLSDFGMAYIKNQGGLYEDLNQPKLPIRWMAPEAVLDNIYTTNSDVWSFGVTLWEIITLGGYPYPGVTTDELIEKIKEGYRMPKPDHCEDTIYDIMKCCWQLNADDRPSFDQLTTQLDNILSAEKDYIDFTFFRGSIYENVQCELLMTNQQAAVGNVIEEAENITQDEHHNMKNETHHKDECCHHEDESKHHKCVKSHHENGDNNHTGSNSHKDENNSHKDVHSYHEGENKNHEHEQENFKHNHGHEKNKNNQHAYDNINYHEDKNSQFGEGADHQRDKISDPKYDNHNNVENAKNSNHMYDNNITDKRNSDPVYDTSITDNTTRPN